MPQTLEEHMQNQADNDDDDEDGTFNVSQSSFQQLQEDEEEGSGVRKELTKIVKIEINKYLEISIQQTFSECFNYERPISMCLHVYSPIHLSLCVSTVFVHTMHSLELFLANWPIAINNIQSHHLILITWPPKS